VNRFADVEEFPRGTWGRRLCLESFCEGAVLEGTDGGWSWKRPAVNGAQTYACLDADCETAGWYRLRDARPSAYASNTRRKQLP
jgi:hypothetical protein